MKNCDRKNRTDERTDRLLEPLWKTEIPDTMKSYQSLKPKILINQEKQ
ncbi:hypothetical protein A3Q56_07675 [Intoshia linei]|uniref:Uncharacterized protein n=1 Tax=Intoshia linei TaxID=1819745 RepID=A0A177ATQ6_9BILA|nr:hypothetical protein A3Q56_07675 [Intoshia linei]